MALQRPFKHPIEADMAHFGTVLIGLFVAIKVFTSLHTYSVKLI